MVGEPGITVGSKVGTTDGTGVGMRVGIDVATCRSVNDSLMKSFFLSDMGKNVTWMIEFNRRGDYMVGRGRKSTIVCVST